MCALKALHFYNALFVFLLLVIGLHSRTQDALQSACFLRDHRKLVILLSQPLNG